MSRADNPHSMAEQLGWTIRWEYDEEPYQMGDGETEHPTEVLGCILTDADGNRLASLWGIGDPDREYGLEVECDLIEQAILERDERARNDATAHNWMAL